MAQLKTAIQFLDGQIERLLHGRFTGGAVRSVVLIGIGTVLAYLTQIAIARLVGADEFGHYVYVLGMVTIGRLIVSLSLDSAALRFVGMYYSSLDWGRIRGFLRTSRRASILTSALGASMAFLVVIVWRDELQPSLVVPLLIGCAMVIPNTLMALEMAVLQAFRLVYEPRVPYNVIRPLVIITVIVTGIYLFGLEGTANIALIANALAIVIVFVISFFLVQSRVSHTTHFTAGRVEKREWSKFCAANAGQSIVYFALSQQSDVVIVGSMIGTTDAGHYSAAMQISALLMLAGTAINQFVAPTLADEGAKHGDRELIATLRRAILLNMAMSVPMFVVVLALGPVLLGMFGPSFLNAYPIIGILSIGCIVNAVFGGSWGDLLTMRGLYFQSIVIVIGAVSLNLALAIYLTPRWGITGTAWATTIAAVVRGLFLIFVVHRHFGFWPWTVLRMPDGRAAK